MEQALLKQGLEVREFNNIKKIGVIADTHGDEIPDKVFDLFNDVDLILHAGDILELGTLNKFEKPLIAVYGNMDSDAVREKLPGKVIIKVNNFKIGLTHGYGAPDGLADRVKNEFDEKPDCIVFGHSHSPYNETKDNILFFNPGSATDKVFTNINSIGILSLNKKIEGEIVKL